MRLRAAADACPVKLTADKPANSNTADRSQFMSFISTIQFNGRAVYLHLCYSTPPDFLESRQAVILSMHNGGGGLST